MLVGVDLLGFHPSPRFLPCQILPEETPMQDQEPDSPLNDPIGVADDPVAAGTQTVNSLVQRIADGKEVICPFYPSTVITN